MRRWILPRNDGEAVEIERFLLARGETVLVSHQPWGASWQGLESSIRNQIPDGAAVYGIELGGQPTIGGAVNIDHHRYRDEDRWRPDSSLEQVAARLGVV